MKNFVRVNLKRTRVAFIWTMMIGWIILLILHAAAWIQYGMEACWFQFERQMQIVLPVMMAIPMSFWLHPFVSRSGAELVHSLPNIQKKMLGGTALLFAGWEIIIVGGSFLLYCFLFPRLFLGRAMLRSVVQCTFAVVSTFFATMFLRSALYGLASFLLIDGGMLLAVINPFWEKGLLQRLNIYEILSELQPDPLNLNRIVGTIIITVILAVIGGVLYKRYFSFGLSQRQS